MKTVKAVEFVAHSTWWCVHPIAYPPASFNANSAGDPLDPASGGRFHPFYSIKDHNAPVPTKYLADHPNGAFAETLLRDDQPTRQISINAVRSHRLTQFAAARTCTLADLRVLDSASGFSEAMRRGRNSYVAQRRLAAIVHAQNDPLFDGLLWDSRQLNQSSMLCVLLFGDRIIGEDDLHLIESYALDHVEGLRKLLSAATSRQFVLPATLVKRTL